MRLENNWKIIFMPSEARLKIFWKIIINCILGLPNLGVRGECLVATKFFQVACHFSMIFIKFYKIPWYFQVFQVYPHFSRFSRFSRSSGNPDNSVLFTCVSYLHESFISSFFIFSLSENHIRYIFLVQKHVITINPDIWDLRFKINFIFRYV